MTRHTSSPLETFPEPAGATPSGPVRELIRRTPLVSFLILSCLLSWWPGGLQAAGVNVPGSTRDRRRAVPGRRDRARSDARPPGIGRLLRSMIQWRAPRRAYLAAVGLPLLVSGTAIVLTVALGATRPSGSDLALGMNIPIVMLLVLLIPGTGGASEEPGWRGFALGRLERKFGVLAGPLVLGGFWVFWHAPLFGTGDILWPDVLVVVAASVVISAVFHAGRDSVLIAMLCHAMNNAVGGSYASPLFHGQTRPRSA